MLLPLLAALALQAAAPDTLPSPAPEALRSAYLDEGARETVRRVRERRQVVDRSITAYRALARERISVGLRAMRRDRVLFRREIAANVLWRRDGEGTIEVLGARRVIPMVFPEPSIPDDLRSDAPDLAFDPAGDNVLLGFGGEDFFVHPLEEGSEDHYRFGSGDTTRIRLPDGRTLRLLELRVAPRRTDARLVRGTFMIDAETHSPVRGVFELAREVDLERDLGEDDEDIPGALKPIIGRVRYLTIEYGLWEGRWWLPRLLAVDIVAQAGGMVDIPVLYERSYEDFVVTGEDAVGTVAAALPAGGEEDDGRDERSGRRCRNGGCGRFSVRLPADTTELLRSEYLPPSIYAEGEALVTEGELRELADVLGIRAPGASPWHRPEFRFSYLRPALLRFNRVEGLALGARVEADPGPVELDATLWLPTAALEPVGELAATRQGFRARHRLALYRRLAAVDPDPRALGFGSSLAALLLGRDDSDYFRSLGAELRGESVRGGVLDYRWRLFAERQRSADRATDLSVPHLLGRGPGFPENILADAADQLGGAVELRWARGLDPQGLRWSADAAVTAETGDFRFARPSLGALVAVPLPFRLMGLLEAAGGTAFGELPLQREWFLGGPATVRGFGAGSRLHGDSYWRGRAEVASAFPGARLVAFADAGWAGERADFALDPALLSAGVGVSVFDGLLRLDLARALRGGHRWRLDLHLDAPI